MTGFRQFQMAEAGLDGRLHGVDLGPILGTSAQVAARGEGAALPGEDEDVDVVVLAGPVQRVPEAMVNFQVDGVQARSAG